MHYIKKILCLLLVLIVGENCAFAENLKMGSRGREVKQTQQLLDKDGYKGNNRLRIDGIFGAETQSAVISFQKSRGLNPNGIVDLATKRALGIYPPRILKMGISGEDVRDLQAILKEKGCGLNGITGNFQIKTRDAVKKFQSKNDLTQTGVADETTILQLNVPYTTCEKEQKSFPNFNIDISMPIPIFRKNEKKKVKVKVVRAKLPKHLFEHISKNINEVGNQIKEAVKQGKSTINIKGQIVEIATIASVFVVFLPLLALV